MRRTRPIAGFLCRFAIVFGLLVAPWPGWEDAYARFLQKSAGTIMGASGSKGIRSTIDLSDKSSVTVDFGPFGSRGIVAFARNPAGDKKLDTAIYVGNRERAVANNEWLVQHYAFSSRVVAYLPTVLVIALILATDIAWRRRLWALVWGLGWMHVYISFLLGLMIVRTIYNHPEIGLVENASFWPGIVSFLHECFLKHIGTHLVTAVPVWILVTFRRDDWIKLLGKDAIAATGRVTPK